MFGIYDMFEKNCGLYADKVAVIHGAESLTYGLMSVRVDGYARRLTALGVRKGTHVTILMRNSVGMLCLYLSLMKLGALISPLNYRESPEELSKLAGYIDSELIIYGGDLASLAGKLKCPPSVRVISEEAFLSVPVDGGEAARPDMKSGDVVLNIFTGGTTGESKAASHTFGGLKSQVESCFLIEAPIREDDVFLNYAPMFHIGGFTAAMQTLCIGAAFIISETFDPEQLLAFVAEKGVTQLSLIPPSLCTELVKCGGYDPEKLSSVRLVRISGGACTVENVKTVFRLFPNTRVFSGYGMSERAVNMVNIIDRDGPIHETDGNISVGRPGKNDECRLTDESGETVTEPGVVGEVCGRSPCMMSGYYGRPAPFDADGWYATGDLMYFDASGYYYFVDRKKDMIKSGGENVYSNVVEQVINSHPSVSACAVVGIPDERLGEKVAAAVVLKKNAPPVSAEELMRFCGDRAAGFKKPRRIIFTDRLPRSGIGKTVKSEVRKLFESVDDGKA